MDPQDPLSLRLLAAVATVTDFIEPLAEHASETLLGDAAPLSEHLPLDAILQLAFFADYLEVIYHAFDTDSTYRTYALVEQFVEGALGSYQQYLDGWDIGDDGAPLTGRGFLLRLAATSELFAFSCEQTHGLASRLAARVDAFSEEPFLVEAHISTRETIIREMVLADNRISRSEKEMMEFQKTLHAEIREYAFAWRREVIRTTHSDAASSDSDSQRTTTRSAPYGNALRAGADSFQMTPTSTGVTDSASALREARKELANLVGLPRVKAEIRRFDAFLDIQRQRQAAGLPTGSPALHFVFSGNPGTGKTTVARILGLFLRAYGILAKGQLVETDRAGLVAEYVGQTAIKTAAKIEEAMDGILFIDEAYALAPAGGQSDFGRESIETLLKRMEDCRQRLVVIAAGYPEFMAQFMKANPGLQSRFTRHIVFDDYAPDELGRIALRLLDNGHYVLTPGAQAYLSILFQVAHSRRDEAFGNARFVRNIVEEMYSRQALRLSGVSAHATRATLQAITRADVPLDQVGLGVTSITLDRAHWRLDCPICGHQEQVGLDLLSRKVRCVACQSVFAPEWPSLVDYKVHGVT